MIPPRFGRIYGNSPAGHRAKINFECDHGFKVNGGREMTCFDGEWRGEIPSCERKFNLFIFTCFVFKLLNFLKTQSSFSQLNFIESKEFVKYFL